MPPCQLPPLPLGILCHRSVASSAKAPWLEASAAVLLCLPQPSSETCFLAFGEQCLYVHLQAGFLLRVDLFPPHVIFFLVLQLSETSERAQLCS